MFTGGLRKTGKNATDRNPKLSKPYKVGDPCNILSMALTSHKSKEGYIYQQL